MQCSVRHCDVLGCLQQSTTHARREQPPDLTTECRCPQISPPQTTTGPYLTMPKASAASEGEDRVRSEAQVGLEVLRDLTPSLGLMLGGLWPGSGAHTHARASCAPTNPTTLQLCLPFVQHAICAHTLGHNHAMKRCMPAALADRCLCWSEDAVTPQRRRSYKVSIPPLREVEPGLYIRYQSAGWESALWVMERCPVERGPASSVRH